MTDFKESLATFFNNFLAYESIVLLFWSIVAFLLGMLMYYLRTIGRWRRIKKELEEKEGTLLQLQTTHAQLKEEMALKEADLQKALLEAEEATQKAAQLDEVKEGLHSEVFHLNQQLEALQTTNESYGTTIEDLNHQILGLKTRNSQLLNEMEKEDDTLNSMAQLQSTYNATRQKLEDLEGKLANLETGNLIPSGDGATISDTTGIKLNELADKLTKIEEENQQLKSKLEEVVGTSAKVEAVEMSTADKLAALEAKLIRLEEENITLKSHEEVPTVEPPESISFGTGPVDRIDADMVDDESLEVLGTQDKLVMSEKISTDATTKNDLTQIEGIGPFLEKQLNKAGILRYEQIASMDEEQIEALTRDIGYFPGRIQRDNWVGQAAKLMEKGGTATVVNAPVTNEDDLKVIEGIGPKIEQLLKDDGILTWQELANSSQERLKAILEAAGSRYRMHSPETWPTQATLAAEGAWEELRTLQEELTGGRDTKGK